jgi:hypothetical protein
MAADLLDAKKALGGSGAMRIGRESITVFSRPASSAGAAIKKGYLSSED